MQSCPRQDRRNDYAVDARVKSGYYDNSPNYPFDIAERTMAENERHAAAEIQITEAMIEAGASELVSNWDWQPGPDTRMLVTDVFKRMYALYSV